MVTRAQFSNNIPDIFDTIVGNALGIGNVWFVDSGHDDATDTSGAGRSQSKPFATLAFALGNVTAANGDTLFISPGHTEDITAADGIRFAANAEGLNVIGLGQGLNRPTFNFTTAATADMEIDAANVTIRNCYFDLTGTDAIVAAIDVNSDHFSLIDCEFRMADLAGQAVVAIDLGTSANFTKILGCTFDAQSAGATSAIDISGIPSNVEIGYCWVDGNFSVGCLESIQLFAHAFIHHNYLRNTTATTLCISFTGACSGTLAYNTYYSTITQATASDPGAMFSIENYHCDTGDVSGILSPAAT